MDQESNRISPNKRWLRSFAPIWVGQLFSLLGSGVVKFALVWYLTNRTGSVVVLTTATFVALLPDVFLAPFAGALVDRWNRKLVMILADSGIALVTLGLAFLFYSNHI
jgi:DHA3 family macrolide efflux protein-like MFS transporter